jgi:P-type Cu+ transporter
VQTLGSPSSNTGLLDVASPASKTIYTCPMHPEVHQDHPGNCLKCGMTLEPRTLKAAGPGKVSEEDAELQDMTRRFWSGGLYPLPLSTRFVTAFQ